MGTTPHVMSSIVDVRLLSFLRVVANVLQQKERYEPVPRLFRYRKPDPKLPTRKLVDSDTLLGLSFHYVLNRAIRLRISIEHLQLALKHFLKCQLSVEHSP